MNNQLINLAKAAISIEKNNRYRYEFLPAIRGPLFDGDKYNMEPVVRYGEKRIAKHPTNRSLDIWVKDESVKPKFGYRRDLPGGIVPEQIGYIPGNPAYPGRKAIQPIQYKLVREHTVLSRNPPFKEALRRAGMLNEGMGQWIEGERNYRRNHKAWLNKPKTNYKEMYRKFPELEIADALKALRRLKGKGF